MRRLHYGRICFLSALILAGCGPRQEPVTLAELEAQADRDRLTLFQGQEPLTQPLTLSVAMARAIKYNLDHKVKRIEEAMARGQADLAVLELLPDAKLTATHGKRNNHEATGSKSLIDGSTTAPNAISDPKNHNNADLTMIWNVLDFGVTWATAKQVQDQLLITQEKRRKAIQEIMREVNVAWWKAAGAAFLEHDLEAVLKKTREMMGKAEQLSSSGAEDPRIGLEYQRGLMDLERQLLALRRQFRMARLDLAALLNLDPAHPPTIALPDMERLAIPSLRFPLADLERLALLNRPEFRESIYQGRIDREEIRKSYLRLLPGLEGILSLNYDGSQFLAHNEWIDASARLTHNLVSLFSIPATMENAEIREQVAELRRLSLAMAVISQVHVSYENLEMMKEEYALSGRMEAISRRIFTHVQANEQASTDGELELVRQAANALMAKMQSVSLYGELQNVNGLLKTSLGLDPLPPGTEPATLDVGSLARIVEQYFLREENLAGAISLKDLAPPTPGREYVVPPMAAIKSRPDGGWSLVPASFAQARATEAWWFSGDSLYASRGPMEDPRVEFR